MTNRNPPQPPRRPPPTSADFESFRPRSERAEQTVPASALRPPQRSGPPLPRRTNDQSRTPRPAVEPERRSLILRIVLWVSLGVTSLVAVGATALTIWSPAGLVREQLIQRVKAKTGRDLVIGGPTSLSFIPSLAITMADVSLLLPPGMTGTPTITMRSLEASVPLIALLQGRVAVDRVALNSPVIDLRVDAQGRRSWDLAALGPQRRVQVAQAPTSAGRFSSGQMPKELQDFAKQSNPDSREAIASRGTMGVLESLSLSDVRVIGGTVRYADDRSNVSEEIQSLDARLALASIASPLDAAGSLVWRREPIQFETRLTSPKQLLEERPARLSVKIAGRPAEASWEGSVIFGRSAELEGVLAAKSPSLKPLLALFGVDGRNAAGIGSASINGMLKANDAAISLSDTTLELDSVTAKGTISIEPRSKRPMLRGTVQISELDLNKYSLPTGSGPPRAAASSGTPRTPPPGLAATPSVKPAQSIEDLLREAEPAPASGTRVRGFTKRTGWSDEPINLAAFGLVDADIKLGLGRLIYQDIKVGQTQMRIALKDHALTAHFDEVQLYDGRGRGLLTVDATGTQAIFGTNFSVDGASALPLLKDAASFDWISGRGKLNVALVGQGTTERQIVSTLQGKAEVTFKDGAVVGYNVPQILRGLMQGKFSGLERTPTDKTDFSEMAASFTIANGIAQNKDLRLTSPLIRITGAGSANMPQRTLDYTLRPKLVTAATSQGSTADAGGLEIPVKVNGSWDRPVIAPDIDGVLKNPDQAIDAVKQLGRQLKSGDGEAINKAKDLLNQLLKR